MSNPFRLALEETAEAARRLLRNTGPNTELGVYGKTVSSGVLGLRREAVVSVVTVHALDEGPKRLVKLEVVFPGTKAGESAIGPPGEVTDGQEAILRTFVEGGEAETLSALRQAVEELIRLGVPQADLVRAFDGALAGYVMGE